MPKKEDQWVLTLKHFAFDLNRRGIPKPAFV